MYSGSFAAGNAWSLAAPFRTLNFTFNSVCVSYRLFNLHKATWRGNRFYGQVLTFNALGRLRYGFLYRYTSTYSYSRKACPCSLVGLSLSLVYPLLGLVGWHKHWIEIAPVCILVISHLLDHSFTELFLEIGIVSRYMSVKVQRSKDAFSSEKLVYSIHSLYSNEIQSLLLHLPFVHLLPYLYSCSVPEQSLL